MKYDEANGDDDDVKANDAKLMLWDFSVLNTRSADEKNLNFESLFKRWYTELWGLWLNIMDYAVERVNKDKIRFRELKAYLAVFCIGKFIFNKTVFRFRQWIVDSATYE